MVYHNNEIHFRWKILFVECGARYNEHDFCLSSHAARPDQKWRTIRNSTKSSNKNSIFGYLASPIKFDVTLPNALIMHRISNIEYLNSCCYLLGFSFSFVCHNCVTHLNQSCSTRWLIHAVCCGLIQTPSP